jgi:phospholipid transport system substrate-binding protein
MRSLFVSLLVAITTMLAVAPLAGAQGGAATRYLRQRHDDVNRILRRDATTDAARTQRSADVTRILSDLLDYDELSRRALGAHWEARTPEQRARFVSLLRQLVERNYEQNLERVLEFEVSYVGEQATAEGTIVTTSAQSRAERRQPPVEIAYSMHVVGGSWRVYDVNTDGVSLVRNYQNQFNRIITQHNWDELIRRMEQRLADGAAQ